MLEVEPTSTEQRRVTDGHGESQGHRERKCADTIGTLLVSWAGHFQC